MNSVPKPKRRKRRAYAIQEQRMDNKFSVLIRLKYNLTCVRCGKKYSLIESSLGYKIPRSIQACHLVTRSRRNTRWRYDNVYCNCYGCHSFIDRVPEEYDKLVIRKGFHTIESLDMMKSLSQQVFRGDRDLIELWIENELEKILPKYPVLNYRFLDKIYKKYRGKYK